MLNFTFAKFSSTPSTHNNMSSYFVKSSNQTPSLGLMALNHFVLRSDKWHVVFSCKLLYNDFYYLSTSSINCFYLLDTVIFFIYSVLGKKGSLRLLYSINFYWAHSKKDKCFKNIKEFLRRRFFNSILSLVEIGPGIYAKEDFYYLPLKKGVALF